MGDHLNAMLDHGGTGMPLFVGEHGDEILLWVSPAQKGDALKYLCKREGMSMSQVAFIGSNFNAHGTDASLLSVPGLLVSRTHDPKMTRQFIKALLEDSTWEAATEKIVALGNETHRFLRGVSRPESRKEWITRMVRGGGDRYLAEPRTPARKKILDLLTVKIAYALGVPQEQVRAVVTVNPGLIRNKGQWVLAAFDRAENGTYALYVHEQLLSALERLDGAELARYISLLAEHEPDEYFALKGEDPGFELFMMSHPNGTARTPDTFHEYLEETFSEQAPLLEWTQGVVDGLFQQAVTVDVKPIQGADVNGNRAILSSG